jgi:hypothetical protein
LTDGGVDEFGWEGDGWLGGQVVDRHQRHFSPAISTILDYRAHVIIVDSASYRETSLALLSFYIYSFFRF